MRVHAVVGGDELDLLRGERRRHWVGGRVHDHGVLVHVRAEQKDPDMGQETGERGGVAAGYQTEEIRERQWDLLIGERNTGGKESGIRGKLR